MKEVLVVRDPSSDVGTPGKLTAPRGFECSTLEPSWIDADVNGKRDAGVSCIAEWSGVVKWTESNSRKNPDGSAEWSYELQGVPDAVGVRIHPGNFAGIKAKGLLSDSEACLLLGRAIMDVEIQEKRRVPGGPKKQLGVTSSRDTVKAFVEHMGRDPFKLTIRWAPGAAPKEA